MLYQRAPFPVEKPFEIGTFFYQLPERQRLALINGQVMKVDQSAGDITLRHGPIKKLGMGRGMTMVFKAQDPAMLKAVKAGDRVKFDAEDVNGEYIVTKIEKAK